MICRPILVLTFALVTSIAFARGDTRGWWPQAYTVTRDDAAGKLTLATPYYTIEQDLKHGGLLSRISLTHGRATNLLVTPMRASVSTLTKIRDNTDEAEDARQTSGIFSDFNDPAPTVTHVTANDLEVVTVTSTLRTAKGADSGVRSVTTYTYHWGYIKIHREFTAPAGGVDVRALTVLATVLDPSLTDYGHRPGSDEEFGADFNAWQCSQIRQWGKIRAGAQLDLPFQTRYVPRYLVVANPGIEGLEWFVSDDLAQWDFQMAGQTGLGYCNVSASTDPLGVSVTIDPFSVSSRYVLPHGGYVHFEGTRVFDYYLGIPILEGHANKPWLDKGFSANRGQFVSDEQIKKNAADGITTMRIHNDGDANGDGLYWRDGSYPPYPPAEMAKLNHVIETCHQYGIKVAPYFSNHELNQAVPEFKAHGDEWGRKVDDQGDLRPNIFYGALMCLKSGWSDYFKVCVDRVLTNQAFDGVYYDWNLAMYCNNPLHVGQTTNGVDGSKGLGALAVSPTGHWDMDEFLSMVEWTRKRVGPDGTLLLHNTLVPMFATENFANAVVGMEFTYGQLSVAMPKPADLPLEWNFAGARSRAVIGYGTISDKATPRLRHDYALTALVTGVVPWPASDEYIEYYPILKPLGDLEQYQFEDGRSKAVKVDNTDCLTALYSRAGETYILVANVGATPATVHCTVFPGNLPHPLAKVTKAEQLDKQGTATPLNADNITTSGEQLTIPADDIVLVHLQQLLL